MKTITPKMWLENRLSFSRGEVTRLENELLFARQELKMNEEAVLQLSD